MKTTTILLAASLAGLFPLTSFSQQKFYYDEAGTEVDSNGAYVWYREVTPLPNGWTYVRQVHQNNQSDSEGAYSVYTPDKKMAEGRHRHYRRADTTLWYQEEYAAGQLVRLESYHPDGSLKRREQYVNGAFQSGQCYAPDGSEQAFTQFQTPPKFPGGEGGLMKFLAENIRYPATARKNNIQGTVVLTFDVEKDGSITNPRIVKDPGGGCGQESVRVVKAMPQWLPGLMDDEPVKVRFTLPVRFRLE